MSGLINLFLLGSVAMASPRRYEVWPDCPVIVFPIKRWQIPFDTVASISSVSFITLMKSVFDWRISLGTSFSGMVKVQRVGASWRRPNIIVTPENRDEFVRVMTCLLEA